MDYYEQVTVVEEAPGYDQDSGGGGDDCCSFIRGCLATLCCCCALEECCGACFWYQWDIYGISVNNRAN